MNIDGSTITDQQIFEAHDEGVIDHDTARIALYASPGWGRREAARARCAELINTQRLGGTK